MATKEAKIVEALRPLSGRALNNQRTEARRETTVIQELLRRASESNGVVIVKDSGQGSGSSEQ